MSDQDSSCNIEGAIENYKADICDTHQVMSFEEGIVAMENCKDFIFFPMDSINKEIKNIAKLFKGLMAIISPENKEQALYLMKDENPIVKEQISTLISKRFIPIFSNQINSLSQDLKNYLKDLFGERDYACISDVIYDSFTRIYSKMKDYGFKKVTFNTSCN